MPDQPNPSLIENPQNSIKKSKLPVLLIVFGVLELLYPALMLNLVIQMSSLYNQLEITPNPALRAYLLIGIFVLFFLIEISFGMRLWHRQKNSELSNRQKRTAQVLLLIGIVLFVVTIPSWIGAIIYPLYALTAQF